MKSARFTKGQVMEDEAVKQEYIDKIINLEWEMFSSVQNAGRRADCQDDPETFRIMRYSQECEWPEALLASYHSDLVGAKAAGRNLMAEKYAWMMEATFPEEFQEIVHLLPPVDAVSLMLIEKIVAINVGWKLELCAKFPKLSGQGRAVCSSQDSLQETSFETYLRGELKTYSTESIALLYDFTMRQSNAGVNGTAVTLLNQVKQYGFDALEQAEQAQ